MAHVVCLVDVEPDSATFTWSEGPAAFEPFTLGAIVFQEFRELVEKSRKKLAGLVMDYLQDEQNLPITSYELAVAGYAVYEAMFDPGAEHASRARRVRKWLESLAKESSVDSLELVVESPWTLPLNVIYDREPDEEEFLANDDSPDRWLPFWGLRYNLAGGRRVDPLRRVPLVKAPNVLLVVDEEIRTGLPEDQQKRLVEFAESHKLALIQSKGDLEKATRARRPDLLYWMSHATPDALYLGNEEISPRTMRKLLRQQDDEHFGGLAFLNACQTAEAGATGSFFEAFHNVGFAGMIGTENQTIDQFANPLGLDFLEAFLDRGESVGMILRNLRARVPLGLLYGTYCPPSIRVDKGCATEALNVHKVHAAGRSLGQHGALGRERGLTAPLPDEPYRSLSYYDRGHRALLAGRDSDIERFAIFLDDDATRILVLHGESGVGKSSFVRAGVIPFLEEECLGYRFVCESEEDGAAASLSPVVYVRATSDLLAQLAHAICDLCARPYRYRTPLGDEVSADLPGLLQTLVGHDVSPGAVKAALLEDPSLFGSALGAIGSRLPFTPIVVIDQAEEVFTLARLPEDRARGRQALDIMRRTATGAGGFKLIVSLRTEYYGRMIDRLRHGLHDVGRIREYLLTDFDEESLVEAVRRPTSTAPIPHATEVPFEKYGFRYDDGVAEEIARRVIAHTTQRNDSVLPLMQVICTQLYQKVRQRSDHVVQHADFDAIGGVEGGLRWHVEQQLDQIVGPLSAEQRAFKKLFSDLYLLQPDGSSTSALMPEIELAEVWLGRTPFRQMLDSAEALRILRVSSLRIGGTEERRYVSLGHDALAKLAAQWKEELTRSDRIRKRIKKILTGAAVAASILAAVGLILLFQKWSADAKLARNEVDGVLEARPDAVPYAIKALQAVRSYAVKDLLVRFADAKLPPSQRLHAACALVEFDLSSPEVVQFLADSLPDSEASEGINIVHALRRDKDPAINLLRIRWENAHDLAARVRWATALLSLGVAEPARQMLSTAPDQTPRTLFIEHFVSWPGDLSVITAMLDDVDDADFRSGLSTALGKLPRKSLSTLEQATLTSQLTRLFREARDGATHSACGRALHEWRVDAPLTLRAATAPAGVGWYINSEGMSMLLLPPGTFRMGSDKGEENEAPAHLETLESFFLCDREVTVEQLERFLDDKTCPESEKPSDWPGADKKLSPFSTCPIQPTSWHDAVLYCNWLSRREHLTPCYQRKGTPGEWELAPEANGYRLPTEAEWEYACRAGSTTEYSSGEETTYLARYAVYDGIGTSEPCASRLPNAWGLFDMHGNVTEWCEDRYRENYPTPGHPASTVVTGSHRVLRGGSAYDGKADVRSARREKNTPASRYRSQGFRVARRHG